ncbi:MAG: IS1 family transposase [Brasilonema angustatum HA4187-MV1]|nr:IS1 family transposase [Brasilonema angustatum HA4187-MV1]
MLLEKISLVGIARALQISELWLQQYVNQKSKTMPQEVQVRPKPKRRLTVQMDELWSFVDHKGNEQWIWLAMDVGTREIVGCYIGDAHKGATIGDRSGKSAQALWDSLPAVYRQCAVCYSDFWVSYPVALPSKRHRAVGKETGLTSYVERFNCTLRQRVSRLVRKTLSFSKKSENHIGAIWNFIHHYNASLPANSSFPL